MEENQKDTKKIRRSDVIKNCVKETIKSCTHIDVSKLEKYFKYDINRRRLEFTKDLNDAYYQLYTYGLKNENTDPVFIDILQYKAKQWYIIGLKKNEDKHAMPEIQFAKADDVSFYTPWSPRAGRIDVTMYFTSMEALDQIDRNNRSIFSFYQRKEN
jgi:hypothetical protein